MNFQRAGFMWPLALYGLSVLWGVAIAYDSTAAWGKFGFVAGGLVVYLLLTLAPSHFEWRGYDIPLLRIFIAATPTAMAVYFLLINDWTQPAEKVGWLEPLRLWMASHRLRAVLPRLHPNVVGGVLAMWLPLQIAALAPRPNPRRAPDPVRVFRNPGALLVAVSCAGLLLSSLRGVWLALAASVGAWLWWRSSQRLAGQRGWRVASAVWCVGAGGAVLAWLGWGEQWLASRPDRLLVWGNSWHLAWDYFYTGLGLGNFTMAYSSYALLVHVPHTTHAHNLFLDIWLEQGMLGLVALAWLWLAALMSTISSPSRSSALARSSQSVRWHTSAVLALVVITVHGFMDDVYYGYGGSGALLLLVPVALLSRGGGRAAVKAPRLRSRRAILLGSAGATVAIIASWVPATRSLWQANLGALLQTRTELSVYQWPQWPIQDAVRRSNARGLAGALQHYRQTLSIDPANAQANRRLGQIELSLGDYDNARRHLTAAYLAAPNHQATRQLFGESLAVTGDPERAAALWRSMSLDQDQLTIRQWWYSSINDSQRARWIGEAIALKKGNGKSE